MKRCSVLLCWESGDNDLGLRVHLSRLNYRLCHQQPLPSLLFPPCYKLSLAHSLKFLIPTGFRDIHFRKQNVWKLESLSNQLNQQHKPVSMSFFVTHNDCLLQFSCYWEKGKVAILKVSADFRFKRKRKCLSCYLYNEQLLAELSSIQICFSFVN